MADQLAPEEIARVREIQIGLRAVKECADCGKLKTVDQFPRYGTWFCRACRTIAGAA